jgi:hypothetical protein
VNDIFAGSQLGLGVDEDRALLGEIRTDEIANSGRFVAHAAVIV